MFAKTVYECMSKAVPQIDMRRFKKKHMAEYKAMAARTPSAGSVKENMFVLLMYPACYGFAYYVDRVFDSSCDLSAAEYCVTHRECASDRSLSRKICVCV